MSEEQLKGGKTAMFGDGSKPAPQAVQLTDEEYAILEERQAQRRTFLTGRRRKDETREPATKDDIRTSLLLNKHQYDIVREIALREGMTIKDLVSAMFQLGIDRYEEKHGKVELRKPTSDKRDLF
jgi:hypothetical protein